nr:dienelactone hydrolase family protein [Thioclava indica]
MTDDNNGSGVASHDNRIDLIRADAPELAALGPHAVGVRTLKVVHPNQINVAKIAKETIKPGAPLPTYDRSLTLEIWYPATGKPAAPGSQSYPGVFIRDGKTQVTLHGAARRDAEPDLSAGPFPVIVISHGYPGNRFLMSDLGENLASKGYVTVSIDHLDSTYDNMAAFGSTLVNRPLDQLFVVDQIDKLSKDKTSFLSGLADSDHTGLIGYSMGGYGAVIVAGGGVTEAATKLDWGAPADTLRVHLSGSASHAALTDPRIKAIFAFAPWGRASDFWDADGLKSVKTPIFFAAGDQDDVAGYKDGVRKIWQESVNANRYLLTFHGANHNAGAPIPAPIEAWKPAEGLDFIPAEHYIDAVWSNVRMNNIAEHFTSAWFGKMLKGDERMDAYLDVVPNSEDGLYSVAKDGTHKGDFSYWNGFPKRTAKGLSLEHATPET